jgi:hypothetical protein
VATHGYRTSRRNHYRFSTKASRATRGVPAWARFRSPRPSTLADIRARLPTHSSPASVVFPAYSEHLDAPVSPPSAWNVRCTSGNYWQTTSIHFSLFVCELNRKNPKTKFNHFNYCICSHYTLKTSVYLIRQLYICLIPAWVLPSGVAGEQCNLWTTTVFRPGV